MVKNAKWNITKCFNKMFLGKLLHTNVCRSFNRY